LGNRRKPFMACENANFHHQAKKSTTPMHLINLEDFINFLNERITTWENLF